MPNIAMKPIHSNDHRADFDYGHGGYRTREHADWMAEWLQQQGYAVLVEDTDRVRIRLTDPEYWWPYSADPDEWEAAYQNLREAHHTQE